MDATTVDDEATESVTYAELASPGRVTWCSSITSSSFSLLTCEKQNPRFLYSNLSVQQGHKTATWLWEDEMWGLLLWRRRHQERLVLQLRSPAVSPVSGARGTTEIILIVILPLLFLLTAFLICKYTCCGAALKKMTKSSHSSKKAEEVVTDASPAMKSCPPALDEGCRCQELRNLRE
ncbi:hypothetical protein QTO34_009939 [Cnephaeus nilssonii]|uniref:Uncharacterized protein n=1 Tax=Cnephaeus nilssonii TaxID=3371016 RepID=A0AA40HEE1_CNENI|nr:hypothetical protein QTO34_009939 [Eptesicus nilssonii]